MGKIYPAFSSPPRLYYIAFCIKTDGLVVIAHARRTFDSIAIVDVITVISKSATTSEATLIVKRAAGDDNRRITGPFVCFFFLEFFLKTYLSTRGRRGCPIDSSCTGLKRF